MANRPESMPEQEPTRRERRQERSSQGAPTQPQATETQQEYVDTYSRAPEQVINNFVRGTRRALDQTHNLEVSGEVRDTLDEYLKLFCGQIYNNLDSQERSKMRVETVMGDGEYEPRYFENAVQEKVEARLENIETDVAQIINHIAANSGEIHTGNDLRTGNVLSIEELTYVAVVLQNISDDILADDSSYMDLVHSLTEEGPINEHDIELTYGVLANMPEDGFLQALEGAYNGAVNRTSADGFNRGATLLALMTKDQEIQLIEQGLNTLTPENIGQRIAVIKNIALSIDTPWAEISRIIDAKVAGLGPENPFTAQLRGAQEYINNNVTRVATARQRAQAELQDNFDPDLFRIVRPFEDPGRLAGFAMTYWGITTALANTILATINAGPLAALNNLHIAALSAGVAYVGATKVGGGEGIETVISKLSDRFSMSSDEREAVENENWTELVSDKFFAGANSEVPNIISDDRFIETLNSMGDRTPSDEAIIFEKDTFLEKLSTYQPDVYTSFSQNYVSQFAENPNQLELNLNLLANAYRRLNVVNHGGFVRKIAVPLGLAQTLEDNN